MAGSVVAVDDVWEPVRLLDASGCAVAAVRAFLQDLRAAGRSTATQRSYAMDLLRWFRFCWAIDMPWDQATRVEARDFCRWLLLREKRSRTTSSGAEVRGQPNAVTGRAGPGDRYAVTTRAHSETVLRGFYEFHKDTGTGPIVNPFPLVRVSAAAGGRTHTTIRWSRSETNGWGCIGLDRRGGSRGASQTSCSTSCSPNWVRIGIAPWSRYGSRPGRGRRSCSASGAVTSIRVSSWSRWSAKEVVRCSSCRPPRMPSCGSGCISRRWRTWRRWAATILCG